ncbi:DEAD/DEAH box helicase domain-containing protein [Halorientalis persicus]|uniref:DEAD/DEAH box helicase domain-containing protein n=1 Tax=Halorientalis persicus TaxID=1367881 RepID=A0A1H8KTB9_9EURY|nr:DEAD/DEAH box helicase [Halorientalis persicus]SEN96129.1 DEAD/DEAH box helicase domain-containing protein [Halorientalis persicus]
MDETIRWLRDRPYYDGQITHQETVSGHEATFAELDLPDRLATALDKQGIERLYGHQATAVERVRTGDDVVLATDTASGKSLAYTVPAFERALDHTGCTLYIAPQVALIEDQTDALQDLAHGLGFGSRVTVAQYTGRQSRSEKEAIRDRQPTVLLTTPDMLHYGILPHSHRLWEWFFRRLETVVIDEVHEYRGVFGSQVGLVMRRLNRVCERFDADPQYVCCSATIGNPIEHAATVTGRPESSFSALTDDESATGPTHWLFWNPPEYEESGWGSGRRKSSHTEAKRLFVDLVSRGFQTVVFTRSRQTAERYATESADELRRRGDRDAAESVTAYQAALTGERRRSVEDGLQSGEIRGVWSTNALELGVDIGGLDAVVLDGYPGTRMQAFQQAGRAGRGTDPSLVVLVGGEDQLDQYFMRNPTEFFDADPERAISNPGNRKLMPGHVCSAARETWLTPTDDRHFGEGFPDVVAELTEAGDLDRRETDAGIRWLYDGEGSPQHEMNLRTVDDRQVQLRDRASGDTIAELPFGDALRDAHPGAIYHHQGRTYEVVDLDLDLGVANLSQTHADYYTQVLHDKTITVEEDHAETTMPGRSDSTLRLADVTMRKQITGYERRDGSSGEPLGRFGLDLPETTLETRAFYFTVPAPVERAMRERADERSETADTDEAFGGGIHAAEHATIAMMPAELLCDRRDVGGLSTPLHPHTDQSTIFVYDGYPGGVGLTERAYADIGSLVTTTRRMVASCDCTAGCPACVQSPHCGNANDPLDKELALHLLRELDGNRDSNVD